MTFIKAYPLEEADKHRVPNGIDMVYTRNHKLRVHQDYQIANILGGSFSQKTYDYLILDDVFGSETNTNHS